MKVALSLALILCTSVGFAQGTSTPPPPAAATSAPTAAPTAPAPQTVGSNYIVGPGDTLQIFVWRNPELSTSVPVRPDGKITTPLVQDMVAVGKTPSQLSKDIEVVLAEYIRNPQVNVIVTIPLSAFSKVSVIGQVASPQSIPYRDGMRVLDAVLATGGLAEFAAGNRAKIVRKQEDGKTVEVKVRLADLVNRGDMKHNLELRPGDVLVIPESRF
jgi:polysaccharide export outer membrane protein